MEMEMVMLTVMGEVHETINYTYIIESLVMMLAEAHALLINIEAHLSGSWHRYSAVLSSARMGIRNCCA